MDLLSIALAALSPEGRRIACLAALDELNEALKPKPEAPVTPEPTPLRGPRSVAIKFSCCNEGGLCTRTAECIRESFCLNKPAPTWVDPNKPVTPAPPKSTIEDRLNAQTAFDRAEIVRLRADVERLREDRDLCVQRALRAEECLEKIRVAVVVAQEEA